MDKSNKSQASPYEQTDTHYGQFMLFNLVNTVFSVFKFSIAIIDMAFLTDMNHFNRIFVDLTVLSEVRRFD